MMVFYLVEMNPAVGSVPQQIHHVLHSRARSIKKDVENECFKTWTGNLSFFKYNIISYVMEKPFLGKLPGPGDFSFCLVFPAFKWVALESVMKSTEQLRISGRHRTKRRKRMLCSSYKKKAQKISSPA
jgi:hypothetical protein